MTLPLKRLHSDSISTTSSLSLPLSYAQSRPYKKLKIYTKKQVNAPNPVEKYIARLETATNSNDVLQILMSISDNIRMDDYDNTECAKKLVDFFQKEQESPVRVKVLSLLDEFAINPIMKGSMLADQILFLLKTEQSTKVVSQGLCSLNKIGCVQFLPSTHTAKIVYVATNKLNSPSHNIQKHALVLLGAFSSISEAEKDTLALIGRYTDSQDSRVRAQAFRSMLMLGARGVVLPPNLYGRAKAALQDDYECVRKEALYMIYELGIRHPEYILPVEDSESEIRLVDAAFGNICSAMCDLSMHVRAQAAHLLGGMSQVGPEFLHQTLDKKLMSDLRV